MLLGQRRLKFEYPNVVFPETDPFCLVCGGPDAGTLRVRFRESECPLAPSKKLEFLSPLCETHRSQTRFFKIAGKALLLPAAGLILFAFVIPSLSIVLVAVGILVAAAGLRMNRLGTRGCIRGTAFLDTPGTLTLTMAPMQNQQRAASRTAAPRPTERRVQPTPVLPYPYRLGVEYDREAAIAVIPSAARPLEPCDGRFVLLHDALLGFLEFSELTFESLNVVVWHPPEQFAASQEPPTWLPAELRDGSPRARRGIALFIRRDEGAYFFCGRAEPSAWSADADESLWVKFGLRTPLPPPLDGWAMELQDHLEAALETLSARLEGSPITSSLLRRVARGQPDGWGELAKTVQRTGSISPELALITPFLLMLLEDPTYPLQENILRLLGSAREDQDSEIGMAAAAGFETYLTFLGHKRPELRLAAVFALQTAEPARFAEVFCSRIRKEPDERVQASMILGILVRGSKQDLPLFLEILKSTRSVRVKIVAALVSVESSPEAPPEQAVRCLREQAGRWKPFQEWWGSLKLPGPLPLHPDEILKRQGLLREDGTQPQAKS